MKKLTLLITFCSLSVLSYAQDFGRTLVSGSFSYSSGESEADPSSEGHSFGLSPKVGWFVNPRLAVGAQMGYTNSKSKLTYSFEPYEMESKFNSFSAGPFVRAYQPVGEQFSFFAEASASYSQGKGTSFSSYRNEEYTSKTKGGNVSLSPGIVFFPSNQIGLELVFGRLGYSKSKAEYEGSDVTNKYSEFSANFGLSNTSVGISFYLGRGASEQQ